MNYKNFLIVASKLDKAGINITTQLSQFGNFKFYLVDKEILYTTNLDLDKINSYDFIIFASKHESKSKERVLCIHAPGNWRSAEFGGEDGKICRSSALFFKYLFEKLHENVKKFSLGNYNVSMEATHHGPLIEKPCIFVEVGSSEREWNDRRASFVIAKTISDTIQEFEYNPYREIAIGIGGPHYCQKFNNLQNKSNIAISHVIPKYVSPITEEMIREAIEKTEEQLDFALLDWKGFVSAEERNEVIKILERLYLNYRKI
ncbi:MAG: D-aminoacyl-tRNA deacylase [Candidatus Pacearchaeota archaeon]